MSGFDLNEHHHHLLLNYLRFAKFQRGQCLKSIDGCFDNAKDTRLMENTYTDDEVRDMLTDIADIISSEIESELINSSHTNVLVLQQVFAQAQKWHLDLDADLAELENRELLDKVKNWEESELSGQPLNEKAPTLSPKKKLAPLNEGGPMQLLNLQMDQLREENEALKGQLKVAAATAEAVAEAEEAAAAIERVREVVVVKEDTEGKAKADAAKKEVEELSEAMRDMKSRMNVDQELRDKSQKELEDDLTSAKHNLLDVQHQLNMAEKELEKKFSKTGAYKNLKKMLSSKNDQIKDLRQKLGRHEGGLGAGALGRGNMMHGAEEEEEEEEEEE